MRALQNDQRSHQWHGGSLLLSFSRLLITLSLSSQREDAYYEIALTHLPRVQMNDNQRISQILSESLDSPDNEQRMLSIFYQVCQTPSQAWSEKEGVGDHNFKISFGHTTHTITSSFSVNHFSLSLSLPLIPDIPLPLPPLLL